MIGNCPHCGNAVSSLRASAISAVDKNNKNWRATTFMCPGCNAVLGASFDAVAQAQSIIKEIKDAMGR